MAESIRDFDQDFDLADLDIKPVDTIKSKRPRVSDSPKSPNDFFEIDRSHELPISKRFNSIVFHTCKIILLKIKNELHKIENKNISIDEMKKISDKMFKEMAAQFLNKIKKYVKLNQRESAVIVNDLIECSDSKIPFQEYLKEYIKEHNHTIDYDSENPYHKIVNEHIDAARPHFIRFISKETVTLHKDAHSKKKSRKNKKGGKKTRKQRKY